MDFKRTKNLFLKREIRINIKPVRVTVYSCNAAYVVMGVRETNPEFEVKYFNSINNSVECFTYMVLKVN